MPVIPSAWYLPKDVIYRTKTDKRFSALLVRRFFCQRHNYSKRAQIYFILQFVWALDWLPCRVGDLNLPQVTRIFTVMLTAAGF